MTKKYIILAPHCDDELIGCFIYLEYHNVTKVYYMFELTEERRKEAIACSHRFNFIPVFISLENLTDELMKDIWTTLLVPNIHDKHPDHKAVNLVAKSLPHEKLYYSVDMNTKVNVLTEQDQNIKKKQLTTIYGSQRGYIYTNHQCYLFESIQKTDTETYITVKTQFEGFHSYPDAPEEVAFLMNKHRHIFHVEFSIEVFHDDRDIEFFMLKKKLDSFIFINRSRLMDNSCENMANQILTNFIIRYPGRTIKVKVSEDNENSATVRFKI